MSADDYCYLTTRGRRTGEPHRIEIWYATYGDTLFMLAGGGRDSDWVRNLIAEPAVTVEVGDAVHEARAQVVEDATEDALARELVCDKYAPRYRGDLTEWRGRALPIAVRLVR